MIIHQIITVRMIEGPDFYFLQLFGQWTLETVLSLLSGRFSKEGLFVLSRILKKCVKAKQKK